MDDVIRKVFQQKGLSLITSVLFALLDSIWPKDRTLLVFAGGRDVSYSDNSRYLFEKFLANYSKEFGIFWMAVDRQLLRDTSIDESIRRHMVYLYSREGMLLLLRAKTVFFSWGTLDLPGTNLSVRKTTIQLWHGIPIKRIGVCKKRMTRRDLMAMRNMSRFTYWISSSRIDRNSVALCTGTPIDQVVVTGYPRNDYLVNHSNLPDGRLMRQFPFLDKTVILYAPTWRQSERARFFPFEDFQLDKLNAFLEKNDAYLILRTHHVDDVQRGWGIAENLSRGDSRVIALNRDRLRDVQDILPYVDVLISDYSGVWVDFLLLDRPIVFVPYDLPAYEEDQGLLYNYSDISPGPKVLEFSQMLLAIAEYIRNPEKDSERRNEVRRIFHEYSDGMAYKRIYHLVKKTL